LRWTVTDCLCFRAIEMKRHWLFMFQDYWDEPSLTVYVSGLLRWTVTDCLCFRAIEMKRHWLFMFQGYWDETSLTVYVSGLRWEAMPTSVRHSSSMAWTPTLKTPLGELPLKSGFSFQMATLYLDIFIIDILTSCWTCFAGLSFVFTCQSWLCK